MCICSSYDTLISWVRPGKTPPSQLRRACTNKDLTVPCVPEGDPIWFPQTDPSPTTQSWSDGLLTAATPRFNTWVYTTGDIGADSVRVGGALRRGPSGCGYQRSNTSKQFRWDECTPDERGLQAESTVHFFAFVQVCVKRGFVKREACFVSRSSAFICVNLRIRLALYYYPSTSCFLCVIFMVCHCNANTHKDLCEISARATFWLRPMGEARGRAVGSEGSVARCFVRVVRVFRSWRVRWCARHTLRLNANF